MVIWLTPLAPQLSNVVYGCLHACPDYSHQINKHRMHDGHTSSPNRRLFSQHSFSQFAVRTTLCWHTKNDIMKIRWIGSLLFFPPPICSLPSPHLSSLRWSSVLYIVVVSQLLYFDPQTKFLNDEFKW